MFLVFFPVCVTEYGVKVAFVSFVIVWGCVYCHFHEFFVLCEFLMELIRRVLEEIDHDGVLGVIRDGIL